MPSRESAAQRQSELRPEARRQRPVDRLETIDEGDEHAALAESSTEPPRSTEAVVEEQARPQTSLADLMAETDGQAFRDGTTEHLDTEHPDAGPSGRQEAQPAPSAERKLSRQVRRLLGFDRSRVVQGVTITGVERATGRHVSFTSSDVRFRRITGSDGGTVGLSFSDDLSAEGDGNVGTLTHRGQTILLPEGVRTTDQISHAAGEGRGRLVRTPWPDNSFYVSTHGYPNTFGVDLKDGRWVHVSGDAFGHLLNDLRPFREAFDRNSSEALALLVCNVGQVDAPGGAAHDLQQALGQFGRRQPVVAATRPMGTTFNPRGGTWGTYVTDGGHWRVLSSGAAQVLGQDLRGRGRAFDADVVEATPMVRDGRTIGVSFRPDGTDLASIPDDAPGPHRTLFVDAALTAGGRFVVHTPDGPHAVDGSTFGRIAANTQVFRDAVAHERPEALALLAVTPAADFTHTVQREFGSTTPVFERQADGGWTMHSPAGQMVSGIDDAGLRRLVHADDVRSAPLEHDGRQAGVSFQDEPVHRDLGQPEDSFVVAADGTPDAVRVHLHDGTGLWLGGEDFAHLVAATRPFTDVMADPARAESVTSFTLLATGDGVAQDFQAALAGTHGYLQPVTTPTEAVEGGWRSFPEGPLEPMRGWDPVTETHGWFSPNAVDATPLEVDGHVAGVSFRPDPQVARDWVAGPGRDVTERVPFEDADIGGARQFGDVSTRPAPWTSRTFFVDAVSGDDGFLVTIDGAHRHVGTDDFARLVAHTEAFQRAVRDGHGDSVALLASATGAGQTAEAFRRTLADEFGFGGPVHAPTADLELRTSGTVLREGGDWRTLPEREGGASHWAEGEYFDEPRGRDDAGPSDTGDTLGKRPRDDESGGSGDESSSSSDDEQPAKRTRYEDVVLHGQEVTLSSLDDAGVVRNAAFDELARGPVRLPGKAEYLDLIAAGIREKKPVSFVVTAILGHGGLRELPDVLGGMMDGARDVDGKVAFVFGVNARAGGEAALDAALAEAALTVAKRTEPVALVRLVWDAKEFPYGDMRNRTIDSPAGQWAVGAMIAQGTHPYLAVQDFDAGSRAVPSGKHVFTHVTDLLRMGEPGERVTAGRPLMISGGYRVGNVAELMQETRKRMNGELAAAERTLGGDGPAKAKEAARNKLTALEKARVKVDKPGFGEEFSRLIDEDMRARDRQVGAHELLPYTPEPNLFIDAVAVMANPAVRFGQSNAEYTNLGKTINMLYADELTRIHGERLRLPGEDAEAVVEQARVDAQNNRHPVRGQAFAADFAAGSIETDLSRLALGWAKDNKLPQSHLDLTTVLNRFFGDDNPKDDRAAKAGISMADYRKSFAKKPHVEREPRQVDATWTVPASDVRQLGGQTHNKLNRGISAPLRDEFSGISAGVQVEHKVIAAHHLATSDTITDMARALGSIRHEVLPTAPAPVPGSLYHAVDPAHADQLRAKVLDTAVGAAPKAAADIAAFVRSQPIERHGHLVNALVQHHTRVTDPDPAENARAGNADALAARFIATQLKNNVVIHHPDGPATTHEPFSGKAGKEPVHVTHHVDADGRHTYESGPPALTRPAPLDAADMAPARPVPDDGSWRHDPAETADWFAPRSDAVTPGQWASRRGDAHVRTVDTEVADVTTDSTPADLRSYTGMVRYDVRRIEAAPGQWVRDFTVKVHLRPGAEVDLAALSAVRDNAHAGVDALLNRGYRLPGGDQFHVTLEFVDNPRAAHTTIEVGDHPVDQTHWRADAEPALLAHETLHYLGVPDEYRDASRIFLATDRRSAVVPDSQGLMGTGVLRPDPQLRPRHLWMVERVADSQVAVPDTPLHSRQPQSGPARLDSGPGDADHGSRPAPVDGADGRREPDRSTRPDKRVRDDSGSRRYESRDERPDKRAQHDPSSRRYESSTSRDERSNDRNRHDDVAFEGRRVSVSSLDLARVVHNAAFDELAPGSVRMPTKNDYLRHLAASVEGDKPVSFVVTAILGHDALPNLPAVLTGMMTGARDVEGRVAFVFGVNTKAGGEAELFRSMQQAAPVVRSRVEPVALVPLVWNGKSFPYGDMRNQTIDSAAGRFAVAALAAKGTHPYLAIQDFDAGSRAVPSGEHVFTHVSGLLRMGEGIDPGRPLMVSGGYRISNAAELVNDTNKRITAELARIDKALRDSGSGWQAEGLRKERAAYTRARDEVNRPGFTDEFARLIDEDMRTRDRQVGAHPLLPYTPEPNLFVDGVALMADPTVRFGRGAAEYTNLGRTINKLYAEELTRIHEREFRRPSDDPDHRAMVVEQARVDALNNRHPLRGQAFTTDFVAGAIETDLSRLALGWAKDGRLPQSHLNVFMVGNRFFGSANPRAAQSARRGADLAGYRRDYPAKSHSEREPQRAGKGEWRTPFSDVRQLGGQWHNTLSPAISTPLSGVFRDLTAGVPDEHKIIAAHHLATSDAATATTRAIGSLRRDVLPTAPPPVPGSLYHAVDPENADGLRAHVFDVVARDQARMASALGAFVQNHPIEHHGHLVNALIQHRNRGTDADPRENTRAGNADDLAARLIATGLRDDVYIHHPDGSTTVHEPLSGTAGRRPVHVTHHIDADGRHTYEPGRPTRTRPAPSEDLRHSAGTAHMPAAQQVPAGSRDSVRANISLSGINVVTGGPTGFRTSEVQVNPLRDNADRVVGATFFSGGEAVRDEAWVRSPRAQGWPANTFFVSGPGNAQRAGMQLADGRVVSVDGSTLARLLNDVGFFRAAVEANRAPAFGLLMSEASGMAGPGGLAAAFQSTLANEFGYRQSAIGPSQPLDRAALDGVSARDGGPWRELHVPSVVADIALEAVSLQGNRVAFRSSQIDVVPMERRGSVIGAIFLDGPLRQHDLNWASREQIDHALLNRATNDPRGAGLPDVVPRPWPRNSFYVSTHGTPQQSALVHLLDGTQLLVDGATFARLLGDLAFFHHAMRRGQAEALTMIICYPSLVPGPGGLAHDFQSVLHREFGYAQAVHAATDEVSTLLPTIGGSITSVSNGGVWRRFPPEPVAAHAAGSGGPVPAGQAGSLNPTHEEGLFHSGLDGGQRHGFGQATPDLHDRFGDDRFGDDRLGNAVAQAEPVRRTGGAELFAVAGNDDVAHTLHTTFQEPAELDGASSSRGDWSVTEGRMLSAKRIGALISHRTDTVAGVEIIGHDPARGPVRFASSDVRVRPLVSDRRNVGVTFHVDAGRKHDLNTVKAPYSGITEYDSRPGYNSRPGDPGSTVAEDLAPFPRDTFFVSAGTDSADSGRVEVHLAGRGAVWLDGRNLATLVNDLTIFRQSSSRAGAVALIVKEAGQRDEAGGTAHDFQQTLDELGHRLPVVASTSDVLLRSHAEPESWRTAVTGDGQWRLFSSGRADLLALDVRAAQWTRVGMSVLDSAPLRYRESVIGMTFRSGEERAGTIEWAKSDDHRDPGSPWSEDTFFLDVATGADGSFQVRTSGGRDLRIEGRALARVVTESDYFRQARSHLDGAPVPLALFHDAHGHGLPIDRSGFETHAEVRFAGERPAVRLFSLDPADVVSAPLERGGRTIGVSFQTGDDLVRAQRWAAGEGKDISELLDPGVRNAATALTRRRRVSSPWSDNAFFVHGDGGRDHLELTLHDGRKVTADGAKLAEVLTASEAFRRAVTRDGDLGQEIVLLASHAGARQIMGLGDGFQRAMATVFGFDRPVPAPSHGLELTQSHDARYSGTAVHDGGLWRVYPEARVVATGHTPDGRRVWFRGDALATTELARGETVVGVSYRGEPDPAARQWVERSGESGVDTPWPQRSFFVDAPGAAGHVDVLVDGRPVRLDGHQLATVVARSEQWRRATADRHAESVVLLVSESGRGADGLAHTFHQHLAERFGYRGRVHAPTAGEGGWRAVPADVVEGTQLQGTDARTGRLMSFGSWEVRTTEMRGGDRLLGLAFTVGHDRQVDLRIAGQTHTGETHRYPQGIVTWEQHLRNPVADVLTSPWPNTSFLLNTHGQPTAVELNLRNGVQLAITGATFARVAHDLTAFRDSLGSGRSDAVTMIVCYAAAVADTGGIARDFQRVLGDLGYRQPVVAGNKVVYLNLNQQSGRWFTSMNDGGLWRSFSSGPGRVLVQDVDTRQWRVTDPQDVRSQALNSQGKALGVTYRVDDPAAMGRLRQAANGPSGGLAAVLDTFLVDAHLAADDRFVVQTGDHRSVSVDAGTLARMVSTSPSFAQALASANRPGRFELLVDRPGSAGERTFLRALEDFAHDRAVHEAPQLAPGPRQQSGAGVVVRRTAEITELDEPALSRSTHGAVFDRSGTPTPVDVLLAGERPAVRRPAFDPADVVSTPLEHNGRTIGVSFQTGDSLARAQRWAGGAGKDITDLLDAGEHSVAAAGNRRRRMTSPWSDNVFYVHGGGAPDHVELVLRDGSRIAADGTRLAVVLTASEAFRRAVTPDGDLGQEFVLLASHTGARRAGLGNDFQRAMNDFFGFDRPVLAPTKEIELVYSNAAGYSGTGLRDGGLWRFYPDVGVVATGHTPGGDRIWFRRDALTTSELTRGENVVGVSFRDQADPAARQWAENSDDAGVETSWPRRSFFVDAPGDADHVRVLVDGRPARLDGNQFAMLVGRSPQWIRALTDRNAESVVLLVPESGHGPARFAHDFHQTLAGQFAYRGRVYAPTAGENGWRAVPTDVVEGAVLHGVDARTGRVISFGSWEVRTTEMRNGGGRLLGLAFTVAHDRQADLQIAEQRHTGATHRYPEGVVTWAQHMRNPVQDTLVSPWPNTSFLISTHGQATSVELNLRSGRHLAVTGATFARLAHDLSAFRDALDMQGEAITMLVCYAGAVADSGGVARDFQRVLGDLGYEQPVVAGSRTVYLFPDGQTGEWETGMDDGGLWRSFSSGPARVLGQDTQTGQWRLIDPGDVRFRAISDQGRPVAMTFRSQAPEVAQARLRQIVKHSRRDPAARDAFFVDAHLTDDNRFVVRTSDQRHSLVDAGTLARVVSESIPFTQLMSGPDQPGRFELIVDRPGMGGERTFIRALEDFAHNRDVHAAPQVSSDLRRLLEREAGLPVPARPRPAAPPSAPPPDPAAPGPSRLTEWAGSDDLRHFAADVIAPHDMEGRTVGMSFHSVEAPVISLGSTSALLHALVFQAIQLEVASLFGREGHVVVSALTGQPGEGDAAEELERALARWLGPHAPEPGWRRSSTPGGVPAEPVVLAVPGVTDRGSTGRDTTGPGSVNDSPQAQDTPPARAKSLREFLNSERG